MISIESSNIMCKTSYSGLLPKQSPESKNASGLVSKQGVMVPGVPRRDCEDRGREFCYGSLFEESFRKNWKHVHFMHLPTPFVVGPHQKKFSVYGTGWSTNSIAWKLAELVANFIQVSHMGVQTMRTLTKLWLLTNYDAEMNASDVGKTNNIHEKNFGGQANNNDKQITVA